MNKILLMMYNMLLLLIPTALNFHGITYAKIVLCYSIFVFLYLILTKKINKTIFRNKTFKYLSIGYLTFFVVVVVTFVINTIITRKFMIHNFFEVLRVLEYYFVLTNYFVLLTKETFRTFHISLIGLIIFNVILSFFQFHNVFGLNEQYIEKIAPTQYRALVNGYLWPRTVGLAGNPNVFGFLMTLLSLYFLYFILKDQRKWYHYVMYLLTVVCVFQSSSRTSYVALIMSNFCLIVLYFFKLTKQDILKTALVSLILMIVHFSLLFISPDSYTWRMKTLINFGNQKSYQDRLEKNKENMEKYAMSFNLDSNQMEEKQKEFFDNEWLMILFKYSIIGVIAYVIMLILPLKTIKENKTFTYSIYVSLVVATFIYMLMAASFHSYLLFNITMLLTAVSLNIKCLQEESIE